jgi:serine/threonine protein kinase
MLRFGPYEVLSELGQGSMGVVYRARDLRLEREVALKVLHGSADEDASRRFVAEARAIARLHHPNVVTLHDAGVWNGKRTLVLELVEGCLRDRLARGPLEARSAAALVRDLARGVHAAHRAGILHRDLKPGNVLIDADGRPRLTDFGLAIETRSLESSSGEQGWMHGTPAFMAPEQISGAVETFGAWTDVWGLGCILHACLTTKPPFGRGPLPALLRRIRHEDAPPVPGAPEALIAIRDRALAKAPAQRFASAEELAGALDAFLEERDASFDSGLASRAPRSGRRDADGRERFLRVTATLTALCVVVVLLATIRAWRSAPGLPSAGPLTNVRR